LKDSELTAITGVDGSRGGAVEGDVVINGKTTRSCIMSLIRKFYARITNDSVFCSKELALSLSVCVCVCVCVFVCAALCKLTGGAGEFSTIDAGEA